MPADSSSELDDASSSPTPAVSSLPSSPPTTELPGMDDDYVPDQHLAAQEDKARERNVALERKRVASLKRKKKAVTKEDRERKAKELNDLLRKSAAFSEILTKKTEVLGRVGTSLDGQALGAHQLDLAEQPKCIVGGTMRDYQLEGVTWMMEVCVQGMSGILADEMGLGELFYPTIHPPSIPFLPHSPRVASFRADADQAKPSKRLVSLVSSENKRAIWAHTSSLPL